MNANYKIIAAGSIIGFALLLGMYRGRGTKPMNEDADVTTAARSSICQNESHKVKRIKKYNSDGKVISDNVII